MACMSMTPKSAHPLLEPTAQLTSEQHTDTQQTTLTFTLMGSLTKTNLTSNCSTDRKSHITAATYGISLRISTYIHIYIHPFNSPVSGTTQVSRYQKGKTNLDFTKARDSEWQWHHLGHMQVCTSLQTTSTQPLCFYRPDALPAI